MKRKLILAAVAAFLSSGTSEAGLRGMNISSTPRAPGVGGQCLTVQGNSLNAGALITPSPCIANQADASAQGQLWVAIPAGQAPGGFNVYVFVNKNSGKCMDAGNSVGQPLVQWDCHFEKNQRFAVNNTGYGWANLMSVRDMACIEALRPNGFDAQTKASTRNCTGGSNEGFVISTPPASCI